MDGEGHSKAVNYDSLAATYERRYEHYRYDGVERELMRFIESRPAVALEVGCGTGHWLEVLQRQGQSVVGLDASRGMLTQAVGHLADASLINGIAERLPLRSGSFDRVFCINALHHFRQKQQFLEEARRVLRTRGGLMIVGLDPHTGLDRSWFYDYFPSALETDLVRFPSTDTIQAWMRETGFRSIETQEAQHFDRPISARLAVDQGRLGKSQASQLALLSDEEYERGLAQLRRDMEAAAARGEELMIEGNLRIYATTGWLP